MAIFKVLCLIAFVLLSSGFAQNHRARNGLRSHRVRDFYRYRDLLKRRLSADTMFRQGVLDRYSSNGMYSALWNPRNAWFAQRARTGVPQVRAKGTGVLKFLPSFETFQTGEINGGVEFKVTDKCRVTVSKTGTLYQLSSNPPDCLNLANLLDYVLPKAKANFAFHQYMTLEKIIIRSLSLNTATKQVEIEASYTGTATLIKDVLTLSNIRVQLSFVWAQAQKFTFDIAGTFTIGDVPVKVKLIRNEEGYNFAATATGNLNVADISRMFKQKDSFLPPSSLEGKLKKAKFDKFVLKDPRIRAMFTNEYGFLFGGSFKILDWEPFDVNVLINKPSDASTTVTIAVFTKSFSISKMLKDLFEIDIKDVPVLGSAVVKNLAFFLSTGDVETPLIELDIGPQEMFSKPYRKGMKVSFEISIAKVYVSTSICISPTLIKLSISQSGELTLGHVVREFLPKSNLLETSGGKTKLKNWPSFIPDPLAIALVSFNLEASKTADRWALTKMNMKLKMADVVSLFNNKIHLKDLELDLNYVKEENPSTSGVVQGRVSLGPKSNPSSPTVDVRIPFPFKNQEITFSFTDFNVKSVVEALAGSNVFPKDFPELFEKIQLDKIALAFDDKGSVNTVSVDASIPGLWPVFGDFSIGNVEIRFEYGKGTFDVGHFATKSTTKSTSKSTWRVVVKGEIVIATCKIKVDADLGTNLLSFSADGSQCSVSVGDVLKKIKLNPQMLPSLISEFTISKPQLRMMMQRTGDKSKSIAFAATTNLFHESKVELALIQNGGVSAVIAGFAVEIDAIPDISFLSKIALTDLAVVYVSKKIPISPYEFLNPSFKRYIQESPGSPNVPEFEGVTIYGRFVPKKDNMLGLLLRKGIEKDDKMKPKQGKEPEITVKISFPSLIFELEVKLGSNGLQIGDKSGWRFTYMKLIISKRLIGLSLKCKITMDSKNPAAIDSTFTGEVTFSSTATLSIALHWEGEWNNPLGLSKRLTIRRMGLSLGINVVSLIPSFGITGTISVAVPSKKNQPPIDISLTLCIDPTSPDQAVFDLRFNRLLLEDLINLFAGKVVNLPEKLATVGFPDAVEMYFTLAGNPSCFGKKYEPGVSIRGTIQIPFLKIRARIDLNIAILPSFKLSANLEMDPISYLDGVLKLVDADTDTKGPRLKMLITENLSDLMIDGSCRVEIFGAMISIKLQISSQRFFFEGKLNLWNLFKVSLSVEISMTATSPSIHVIGEMQNDLFSKIKQKASQAIQSGAKTINKKIEGAQTKIRNAQREVDRLLGLIEYHKGKIEQAKRECRNAPWYKKWICIGTAGKVVYHGAIIAGLWVAHKAATVILKAADLFLEGVKGIIKVGAAVVQKLVNITFSMIDIKYVKFDVQISAVTKKFNFEAKIVILSWTFTPKFSIDFTSSATANSGIDSAGGSISKDTMAKVKK